jgi:hypothetical protein
MKKYILLTILLTSYYFCSAYCPRPYIRGPRALCGTENIGSYEIENLNPNTTSGVWTVTANGTTSNVTNNTIDVDWSGVGMLIYNGYDVNNNLIVVDTVKMQPCCTQNLSSDWKLTDFDDHDLRIEDVAAAFGTSATFNLSTNTVTVTGSVGFIQGMLNLSHTNINFTGCTVEMGSGAIVFLADGYPGAGLPAASFISSTFLGVCAMWHGFQCGTDTYIYSDESNFQDAEYAFVLPECSSIFQFYKTSFDRNFIAMYRPHGLNQFYFRSTAPDKSVFKTTNFYGMQPITLPAYPGQGGVPFNNTSFAGMYLYDLDKSAPTEYSIPIYTSGGLAFGCSFEHLSFGIMGFNSIVDVHNCTFTDIQNWGAYNYRNNLASAIYSVVFNGNGTKSMEVGDINGSDYFENLFTDCFVSIYGRGNINSYIKYNHVVHNGTSSPLEYAAGVRLTNSLNTTIRILNNDFTDNFVFTNAAPYYSTAIAVTNPTIYYQDLQISNNIINDNRYGIYLNNVKGITNNARFLIDWNVITSSTSYANLDPGQFVGISLNHAYIGDVLDNIMQRTVPLPADPSFQFHMYGIVSDDSRDLNIDLNLMEHYGTGMQYMNNSLSTYLHCNDMYECMQGVYLANVTMSQQGTITDPWDNLWDGFPTSLGVFNRMDGTGTSFYWAFRGAPNPPSNIYSFTPSVAFVLPIPYATSSNSYCPTGGDGRALLNEMISNNIQYDFYPEAQIYMARQIAYSVLKNNSTLMNSDANYIDYVNANSNTNYQYYDDVDNLINQDQKQDALDLLNLISDTNLIENNKSFRAKLALQVDLDPEYVISSSDSIILNQIAYTNVWEGGDGVFTARHLLELQIIDAENSNIRIRRNLSESSADFSFYPNPNNGIMNFSSNAIAKYDEIQIMDLSGKVVYIGRLSTSINVSYLESGVYSVAFMNKLKFAKIEKLVINH